MIDFKYSKTAVAGPLRLLLLGLCLLLSQWSLAQTTTVRGQITDLETGEPLISAAVHFAGTTIGINTDFDGNYELSSSKASDTLVVTYLGYQTLRKKIELGKTQTLNLQLEENAITLTEAVVTFDEGRYRNKNNPAVELVKKVIAAKDENRASNYDFYEYEKYEKVLLGLSNVSEKFKRRKIFKKIQFLFENLDTVAMSGKEMLPIYLKESLADVRYRKSPEANKEIVVADTMVTFDGYADDDGFNQYLNNLYQNIDIYDNNIVIIKQQFLSPVAESAPNFYKFFIQDTLMVDGVECIELFFAPRNKLDILFQGFLYIAHQDNYNIKQVEMSVNSNISLNWVKSLELSQTFEKRAEGYIQVKDEFAANFGLTKNGMGIYGNRSTSREKIVINQTRPDEDYKGLDVEVKEQFIENPGAFWEENRHEDLTDTEADTYQKIDSLKNVKLFKRAMNIATLALSGYTKITPYFEMGPVNTFYSFNPVEGFRLRVGGRTRPELSEKLEVETYAAYGFKDERWKGYLGLSHSLQNGNLQKFPVRRLRLSAQHEVQIPGQELQFVQEDNILLSFKRGTNDKYLYNKVYRFEYLNEFKNKLTLSLGMKNWSQSPAGGLIYRKTGSSGDTGLVNEIRTTEINTVLRWAPKEQFYQGKTYRIPIYNQFPVFTLRYNIGVKGFLGGEYNYHNVSLRIFKRFFLSRLGYSDVYLEGGMIAGQLPYPLMTVHTGNQTYSYQLQGFNMMNFMEFVSDRYFSINIDHDFNGLVLNRIPLIRKLKLREVFNVRILYGAISDKNDPALNDGLIGFPRNADGDLTTFSLEQAPYIEGSLGLANVFKFFRVDLVRRFTYLDNPVVGEWGIRARFKIYF